MSLLIANRSSIPWRASKYWSDFKRSETAEESGSAPSFSATSAVTPFSTTRSHAPAFQQRNEEHPGRRQVEHVLGPAVRGAPHLDNLQGPEEVPSALEVPRDDHAVRQGLLDAPAGIPFVGRPDLGDEKGRAAFRAQDGAEPEEEVPDAFLVLDPVADGGHGVQDEAADLLLLDEVRNRVDEEPSLREVHLLLVDAQFLVHLREVEELELALFRQALVEEVERDDVHQELVGRFGDAQIEAVLTVQGPADQEFDADGRLAGADGSGDQDRVAAGDPAIEDVIDRVDSHDTSLPLAVRALFARHRSARKLDPRYMR